MSSSLGNHVVIDVGPEPRDIYDVTNYRYVANEVRGVTDFRLPPDSAAVIVVTPPGRKLSYDGRRTLIDGVVVDYHRQ